MKEKIKAEIKRRIKVCKEIAETRDNEIAQAIFEGKTLALEDMLRYVEGLGDDPACTTCFDRDQAAYLAAKRSRVAIREELSKWLREVKARAVTRLPRNDPATIMASTAIITTIDNIIEHVESL